MVGSSRKKPRGKRESKGNARRPASQPGGGGGKTQKILFVVIGIIVALIMCEAMLSILQYPRFYTSHSLQPQFRFLKTEYGHFYTNAPSSNIKFVYDGNPRGYFDHDNAVYHRTNSDGFRGKEFRIPKPSNTFRIVFLGDSFTFGEGVKDDDIFTEKLAHLLNENRTIKATHFESLNFGVGGYNTEQSLFLLKNYALKTDPDSIILTHTLNDAEPKLYFTDPTTRKIKRRSRESHISEGLPDPKPPETLLYKLRTAQMVWQATQNRNLNGQMIRYYRSLYDEGNPGWKTTAKSLWEFSNICESRRIECTILLFPLIFRLDDRYPFKTIHEKIKTEIKSGKSNRIHFIDLFEHLKGRNHTDLWVHPTDQHPNEFAHRIVAEAIFKTISFDGAAIPIHK